LIELIDMDNGIISTVDTAKRSCNRCFAQKGFRPSNEDKEIALKNTKSAAELYRNKFDELRKNDDTVEKINIVKYSKTLCLDAIDACEKCNKERPRIKEILLDLPK